jgi:hypothetical protein
MGVECGAKVNRFGFGVKREVFASPRRGSNRPTSTRWLRPVALMSVGWSSVGVGWTSLADPRSFNMLHGVSVGWSSVSDDRSSAERRPDVGRASAGRR